MSNCIIASFGTVVPALTTILALDMIFLCLTIIFATYITSKAFLWVCKKWRLGKKVKKFVLMTFWEWFKNNFKTEISNYKSTKFRRKRTCYSSRTYCRSIRGNMVKQKGSRPTTVNITLTFNSAFAAHKDREPPDKLSNLPRKVSFDSDSYTIGIDSQASCSMFNRESAFIEINKIRGVKVKGIGGQSVEAKGIGTVKFKIEDDAGKVHVIKIKNTLYVPAVPISLICPQHWAQQASDHYPTRNGTWCALLPDSCVIHWDQLQFKRTVPYDAPTNTPRFRTAPGATQYRSFVAPLDHTLKSEDRERVSFFSNCTCCHDANVITDDEGGEDDDGRDLVAPLGMRQADDGAVVHGLV